MIRINCTNCKAQLSIDDAFAGGVCRCQYCGTIQTVPKHLKGDTGMSSGVVSKAAGSKALYQNKARAGEGMPSSGLDDIANAIATSSGLSRSALSSGGSQGTRKSGGDLQPPEVGTVPVKSRTLQILTISAVAIVLLLGVIIGVLLSRGGTAAPAGGPGTSSIGSGSTAGTSGGTTPTTPVLAATPTFLGQPLTESSIVFVIDRGDSNRDSLEYVKQDVLKTIKSLRADQKFQVVFWKLDRDPSPKAVPASISGPTADALSATSAAFDDVFAWGSTKPNASFSKAFAAKPAAVVIVSAKPVGDEFPKAVMDARKDSTAKVYCFSINAPASAKAMSDVAKKTGGAYRDVSLEQLQSMR